MSKPFKFEFEDVEDLEEDHISGENEGLEVANASAGDQSPAGAAPCLHTLDDLVRQCRVALIYTDPRSQRQNHTGVLTSDTDSSSPPCLPR